MSWSWISRKSIKEFQEKNNPNHYPRICKNKLLPKLYRNKPMQSTRIEKIIGMRWTKNAQQINNKFPEEYLHNYL